MSIQKSLVLVLSNDISEIKRLVSEGYCPVECSIAGESIIDELAMDHHGENSHLEGVAVRAYRDNFGVRKDDPRFVSTGSADADCTFAVAALAGLLPHPNRVVPETTAPPVKAQLTKNLIELAETVNAVDVNPIGLRIPDLAYGEILMSFNALTYANKDTLGFYGSVNMWRNLLDARQDQIQPFLNAAKDSEAARISAADEDLKAVGKKIGPNVLLLEGSKSWGFDVWYGRKTEYSADTIEGWDNPIVVSLTDKNNVTIGCPNNQVAEILFGQGGLKNVLSKLEPAGWGGRESIGGSPRGVLLTVEQARATAQTVANSIIDNNAVTGVCIGLPSFPMVFFDNTSLEVKKYYEEFGFQVEYKPDESYAKLKIKKEGAGDMIGWETVRDLEQLDETHSFERYTTSDGTVLNIYSPE